MPLALLTIGINYNGQLHGCVNDSDNMIQYFKARQPLIACWQMVDTVAPADPSYPSRYNIEQQLLQIAKRPGFITNLIVHYSGHGSQTRDRNGDEADGLDEVLVPADYNTAGFITDDWLLRNFVTAMPATVNVLCIFDSCHSGTALDLRYNWVPARRGGFMRIDNNMQCSVRPNVTLLSGCLDAQYSYETDDTTYGVSGALTSAFLNTLCQRSTRDPGLLLTYIQQKMSNQTAHMSSTRTKLNLWNFM